VEALDELGDLEELPAGPSGAEAPVRIRSCGGARLRGLTCNFEGMQVVIERPRS
jgi:hypothetical protein